MEYWNKFVEFMYISQDANVSSTLKAAIPSYWWQNVAWTLFLAIASNVCVAIISQNYPVWYASLDKDPKDLEKKKQLDVYIAAYMHHLIAVPIAIYFIYSDVQRSPAERAAFDYAANYGFCIPISFGYLCSDFILYALPQRDYTYMLHHLLAIALGVFPFIYPVPGYICRYVPYIVISELSAIAFLTNWFLKLSKGGYELSMKVCKYLFPILFFLVRLVSLPVAFMAALKVCNLDDVILAKVIVYLLFAMQVFWMGAIIKSFSRLDVGKTVKKE